MGLRWGLEGLEGIRFWALSPPAGHDGLDSSYSLAPSSSSRRRRMKMRFPTNCIWLWMRYSGAS